MGNTPETLWEPLFYQQSPGCSSTAVKLSAVCDGRKGCLEFSRDQNITSLGQADSFPELPGLTGRSGTGTCALAMHFMEDDYEENARFILSGSHILREIRTCLPWNAIRRSGTLEGSFPCGIPGTG